MKKLNKLLQELTLKCVILRYDENDEDIDVYCDKFDEIKVFFEKEGFVLSKENSKNLEFIKYIDNKFIVFDISNTPLHASYFDVDLKKEYFEKYLDAPDENDLWLRSIRYLLSFRRDKKSYQFFMKNKQHLIENNFYLDYLNINPFQKNIDIDLFFKNKNKFIRKFVKPKYRLELIINKIKFIKNNIKSKKKIAIIGVDGSGKTTIISILNQLNDIKTQYMGFKEFRFEKFYQKLLGINPLFTILGHFFVFIENYVRYFRAIKYNLLGFNVIFDRYPKIEYKIHQDKKTRILYHLFYRFFYPNPDKTIFISGIAKEIFARKQEMSIDEINIEQPLLKANCDIEIQNKNNQLEITINKILKEIYK